MKIIFSLIIVGFLFSCAAPKPLYNWGDYENLSYKAVKSNEDADIQNLMLALNTISKNTTTATSGRVPPGVCADYGYFLMKKGKVEEGKKWMIKEKELYPESAVFIDRILIMTEL